MSEPQAAPVVHIADDRFRVTDWRLASGAGTGWKARDIGAVIGRIGKGSAFNRSSGPEAARRQPRGGAAAAVRRHSVPVPATMGGGMPALSRRRWAAAYRHYARDDGRRLEGGAGMSFRMTVLALGELEEIAPQAPAGACPRRFPAQLADERDLRSSRPVRTAG